MTSRLAHPLLALVTVLVLVAPTGCGTEDDETITEDSTCQKFLAAPSEDQRSLIMQLAGKYGKEDYTTPLGMPAVPHYCANHPDTTLKEFFSSIAQD